jgi:hypothetical protein
MLRVILYVLVYAVAALHIGFYYRAIGEFAAHGLSRGFSDLYCEFLAQQGPLLFGLIVTMPLLLYDLAKFSNRIAGPLYRCRKVMQEMASGKAVPEFHPRKHDHMKELFQAFNALIIEWNARLSSGAEECRGSEEKAQQKLEGMSPTGGNGVTEPQRLNV